MQVEKIAAYRNVTFNIQKLKDNFNFNLITVINLSITSTCPLQKLQYLVPGDIF
jgi:hypothetical protein